LAPEQVRVLPISEHWNESANEFVADLRSAGVRAHVADRDTLSARIRDAELMKVPYMGVIGEREAESGTVAVRRRGAGRKQDVMDRSAFRELVLEKMRTRALA